jgi:NTP pyrophosphatase (non-canonical NTP hydrolase)
VPARFVVYVLEHAQDGNAALTVLRRVEPPLKTLRQIQQAVDHLIREEWNSDYWVPLASLARLTEEVGELAREINHRYGQKPKKADELDGDIATELGDILYILAALANSIDVDLEAAFDQVMSKYHRRDALRWKQGMSASEPLDGSNTESPS